jgi:hypothetical protein
MMTMRGSPWAALIICLGLVTSGLAQPLPPPPPPNPVLSFWPFAGTNYPIAAGYAPIAFTNITNVPIWFDDAVLVDTSNTIPAYLQYNVVEADGHTNFSVNNCALWFWFSPDWSSTNAAGAGPGYWANLLSIGQWTSNASYGWWSLYTDPAGCNFYFSAQNGGTETNYFTAPISWTANTFHFIGLEYSPSNSVLCLDGELTTNGPGVTLYPGPDVLTNGLFIGSDSSGFAQAQGQFVGLRTWDEPGNPALLTLFYRIGTNQIAAWGGGGGGIDGADFSGGFSGSGSWAGTNCPTNGPVYITNFLVTPVSGQGPTVTFTVAGGTNGPFDAFGTTSVAGIGLWTWLGQVYTCNTYQLTNQPGANAFYMLAYLTSTSSGIPVAWCLQNGLNAQDPSLATEDPKADGMNNLQKYLYGADPQKPVGFSIWVASPNGITGLP